MEQHGDVDAGFPRSSDSWSYRSMRMLPERVFPLSISLCSEWTITATFMQNNFL
jgi:hypothetical protein